MSAAAKKKTPAPVATTKAETTVIVLPDSLKNDGDNTDVFVGLHGKRFAFDPLTGQWLFFSDGDWLPLPGNPLRQDPLWLEARKDECARAHTWQPDANHLVMMAIEDVYHKLIRQARTQPLPDAREQAKAVKHAVDAGNLYRLNAMQQLARNRLVAKPNQFNQEPFLLGCANGIVDLRQATLRDGTPGDRISKNTGVRYDPAAACPLFDQFLLEIMEADQEMVSYLWRVFGYCLTGDVSERAFFILHGSGRNGKTTLVELLLSLLGARRAHGAAYAQKARFNTFLEKYRIGGGANDDVAHLAGARVVIAAEASGKQPLDVPLVKELTGGDTARARYLYGGEFEFKPQFKLMLVTNHVPPIYETTEAIWDRLHYINFDYRVPDEKVDRRLAKKLEIELPGILAKAVAGCLEWQQGGLRPPAKVLRAKKDLYEEMDTFGEFLVEMCEFKPGAEVLHSELYFFVPRWMADRGFSKAPSSKALRAYLEQKSKSRELPIRKKDKEIHHVPVWVGMQMKAPVRGQKDLYEL